MASIWDYLTQEDVDAKTMRGMFQPMARPSLLPARMPATEISEISPEVLEDSLLGAMQTIQATPSEKEKRSTTQKEKAQLTEKVAMRDPEIRRVLEQVSQMQTALGIPSAEEREKTYSELRKQLEPETGIPSIAPLIAWVNTFPGEKLDLQAPTPVYPKDLSKRKLELEKLISKDREEALKLRMDLLKQASKLTGTATSGMEELYQTAYELGRGTPTGGGIQKGPVGFLRDFEKENKDAVAAAVDANHLRRIFDKKTALSDKLSVFFIAALRQGKNSISNKDIQALSGGDTSLWNAIARFANEYFVGRPMTNVDEKIILELIDELAAQSNAIVSGKIDGSASTAPFYGMTKEQAKSVLLNKYPYLVPKKKAPVGDSTKRKAPAVDPSQAIFEYLLKQAEKKE